MSGLCHRIRFLKHSSPRLLNFLPLDCKVETPHQVPLNKLIPFKTSKPQFLSQTFSKVWGWVVVLWCYHAKDRIVLLLNRLYHKLDQISALAMKLSKFTATGMTEQLFRCLKLLSFFLIRPHSRSVWLGGSHFILAPYLTSSDLIRRRRYRNTTWNYGH